MFFIYRKRREAVSILWLEQGVGRR